jgi:hypothetical protein
MAGASDRNARRGAELWLKFVALSDVPFELRLRSEAKATAPIPFSRFSLQY